MTCDETIHATAVSLVFGAQLWADPGFDQPHAAVVLRGASGSGKSDLALRLIAQHAARLIADDRVAVSTQAGQIICSAPAAIAGLLEVRGLGLLRLPPAPATALALVVDLVARTAVERLPAPDSVTLCNITIPRLFLHAFDASTPAKIVAALAVVKHPELVIR